MSKSLTIKELKDKLNALDETYDSHRVCVVVDRSQFGSTPVSNVIGAGIGIDWDSGKLMLRCENKLIEAPIIP